MQKKTMSRLIAALSVGVLITGSGATAAAANTTPKPMSSARASTPAVRNATEGAQDIRAHWTPARMRVARPAPEPRGRHSAEPQTHELSARSAPGAAAAGTGERDAPARPRSALADITQSQVWNAHGQMPATTIGKLYYDKPDGPYECTATVISSANKSLIWTAGHCVSDGNGHWFDHWMFVPDYADGDHPLGSWSWKSVATPRGYLDNGDQDYDLAAIALQPLNGNNVADLAGSQGYKFNYGYEWQAYEFGYPFDTHPARNGITGQQLRYCVGQTWRPGISPFQPDQQAIHCDQGHGASGGPWLDDLQLDRGWGYLVGNVSYHPDDNSDEERSPHFGDAAVNVYNNQQNA